MCECGGSKCSCIDGVKSCQDIGLCYNGDGSWFSTRGASSFRETLVGHFCNFRGIQKDPFIATVVGVELLYMARYRQPIRSCETSAYREV